MFHAVKKIISTMLEMELCELIYEIYRDNFEMIFIRFFGLQSIR